MPVVMEPLVLQTYGESYQQEPWCKPRPRHSQAEYGGEGRTPGRLAIAVYSCFKSSLRRANVSWQKPRPKPQNLQQVSSKNRQRRHNSSSSTSSSIMNASSKGATALDGAELTAKSLNYTASRKLFCLKTGNSKWHVPETWPCYHLLWW